MIEIYPLPYEGPSEQPVGCAYLNSANGSAYHCVQAPTIVNRIAALQAKWQYCNFCGDKSFIRYYSCSTRTKPLFSFRDGVFCSTECCNLFHSSSKERRKTSEKWSHVALCSFSEYICGFVERATVRQPIGTAADQYEVFAQVFELVKRLHRSIDSVLQQLKDTEYEQRFEDWAETFDDWLQNLPAYNKQLARRDLELFLQRLQQFPKSDTVVSTFKEITEYLYVSEVQQQSVHRADRPLRIIAFDGGGMRAIVTLRVVWYLMNELARLSGKPHPVRLSDYFDLAVGTSTGAIVASGLFLLDMQIDEIQSVYNYVGEHIFCEKNRYRGQKIISNMATKYNDGPMIDMLMKQTAMHRLDKAPLLCDAATRPTRVVITALEVGNTNNEHLILFRNYEPIGAEKEERIEGTNHLYLWEALRAATAAPHYFHQYSRFYAPIDPPDDGAVPFLWRGFSGYRYSVRSKTRKSRLVTHRDLILQRDPSAAALLPQDNYMNESRIFSDAGMEVNNPCILAVAEARRIFPGRKIGIIISIGTGKSDEHKPHETLNKETPTPLESAILFNSPSIIKVIRDVLMASIINPASESEDTAHLMKILSEDLCDYARLNPGLEREYLLDDASADTTKKMIQQANSWCESTEGASLIRICAQKLLSI